MSKLNIT